jgi:hypothetical protein
MANAWKLAQSAGFSASTSSISSDFGNSITSSRTSSPQPTRQGTPVNSDDEEMTEDQKRAARHGKKCAAKTIPRCPSAPGSARLARHRQERRQRLAPRVPGQGLYPTQPCPLRIRRRWPPRRHLQSNQKEQRLQPKEKDRRVQRHRSQPQECKPEVKRAELEACDQGAVQGKRIRVLHKATLPKPES